MPVRDRTSLLGLLGLASLVACSSAASPPASLSRASSQAAATVATFEGEYDPARGGLTIRTTPVGSAAEVLGRMAYSPFQDGDPNNGPDNTFQLTNGAIPGVIGNGCGVGTDSYDANIVLRSFFKTQSFSDVAIELTNVTPGGFVACNSAAAYGGMSNASGLWSYGPIGTAGSPTDRNTVLWRFRFPSSLAFTFTGRITAQLDPIAAPPSGGSEFEWTPYMFVDPPHSFQVVGTTLAHVIWDGSAFVDTKGIVAFAPVGATAPNHPVGLTSPPQQWAGPFPAFANRYEASPSTAALNLSGDFTVCAKFKPGVNPDPLGRKIIVAKGNAVDQVGYGWALTQQHGPVVGGGPQYGFFYRTGLDIQNTDTFVGPGNNPENSTFDYSCAGRNANEINVVAHGRDVHFPTTVTGSFFGDQTPPRPDAATLPLVIGNVTSGLWPATDVGVYELIFDSRGATVAVMNDIVDRAEGRKAYNGASYYGNDVDALAVTGADGGTYHFPIGATAPVSSDGSGLLDPGTVLTFGGTASGLTGVLPTNPSGYCAGAEVVATNWGAPVNPSGFILSGSGGGLRILIFGDGTVIGVNGNAFSPAQDVGLPGWAANSRHTFKVCATAHGTGNNVSLYVDSNTAFWTGTSGNGLDDLTAGQLLVGTNVTRNTPLTGARVGRVFACPTAVAASCN
jgi:hypothetical protein